MEKHDSDFGAKWLLVNGVNLLCFKWSLSIVPFHTAKVRRRVVPVKPNEAIKRDLNQVSHCVTSLLFYYSYADGNGKSPMDLLEIDADVPNERRPLSAR